MSATHHLRLLVRRFPTTVLGPTSILPYTTSFLPKPRPLNLSASFSTSKMSGYTHDSKPCCSIPPVVSDYQPKGSMTKRQGMDTYEINTDSNKAIIAVFDIFGFHNNTQQGADALAKLGFHVVMPNWFKGPAITAEEAQAGKIGEFIQSKAPPPKIADEVVSIAKELKSEGKSSVGLYGLCWGGKVCTLSASKEDSLLSGVASIHPAMVNATDFENLKEPFAFFPSGDEPEDEVNKSWEVIKSLPTANKSVFKNYKDMHHGWAGARSKLAEEENVKQFEDVYRRLGDFFNSVAA